MLTDLRSRLDTWVNAVTGLGTSLDKTTRATVTYSGRLADSTIKNLIRDDDLARKIVHLLPTEMLRRGWKLSSTGDRKAWEQACIQIKGKTKQLHLKKKIQQAMWLARAYGGSLLIPGLKGVGNFEAPLTDNSQILDITCIKVVDRRFVTVVEWNEDPDSPDFEMPLVYKVTVNNSAAKHQEPFKVHASRVIRFDSGTNTDPETALAFDGWHDSVLQEAYPVLRQFNQAFGRTANALTDWSQAVFKLQGLVGMVADGKGEALQNRMQIVNLARSTARAVLVDAETEDFSRDNIAFGGVDSLLQVWMMRISSVTGYPVSLLFGRSAAGMNATGEMDFQAWYNKVGSLQVNELESHLTFFYDLLFRTQSLGIQKPEGFSIEFLPLKEPTQDEILDRRLKQAQVDAIYIDREVVESPEVAINRFGDGDDPLDTKIDLSLREELLAQMTLEDLLPPPPPQIESDSNDGQRDNNQDDKPGAGDPA